MQGVIITVDCLKRHYSTFEYMSLILKSQSIQVKERLELQGKTSRRSPRNRSKKLENRAPIIAFMGHVDHGKTSLVDAIRKSNIAGGEAELPSTSRALQCQRACGSLYPRTRSLYSNGSANCNYRCDCLSCCWR